MPRAEALNEQAPITGWAAETESKRDGNDMTNDENWKRNSNKPRPAEEKYDKHADDSKCEAATGPDDEPRLGIKSPRCGLLGGVHET